MAIQLTEHTLSKQGCPLHYWTSKQTTGPWLVFLHGAGTDHHLFDPQLNALPETYRVILLDIRGHGLSRPLGDNFSIKLVCDDLLAIMNQVQCEQATIIGHSMGGNIAQEMTNLTPEKIKALVLIGCVCNTAKLSLFGKLATKLFPALLNICPWGLVKWRGPKISAVDPKVQKYLLSTLITVTKKDFCKIYSVTAKCLHYVSGYQIKKPILLVCGAEEHTRNIKKAAQRWAAGQANIKYYSIPLAGHCANMDNPGFFNQLLLDFIKGIYLK